MARILKELGYIGLEVSNLDAWRDFAGTVLGLEVEEAAGSLKLRMDEQDYRIAVAQGSADDIIYAGWRTNDADDLQAFAKHLDAHGIAYNYAADAELALRGVAGMLHFKDSEGLRHEVYYGLKSRPFHSEKVSSGFVTGTGGFGHIVFGSKNYDNCLAFAETILQASLSDTIQQAIGPSALLNVSFFHINERHHSIAFADRAGPKRLHHFMLEVRAMDDVGSARDRHLKSGLGIAQDIGQHPNDRMISYYGITPSGFLIEYGAGAIKVDDPWQPGSFFRLSEWGHRPFGIAPAGTPGVPAPAAKPAAIG